MIKTEKPPYVGDAIDKPVHPVVFTFLILPFGVLQGYVTVTLGYLLSNAGISVAEVAAIVGASITPHIFKFLWAPLIDTTLTRKKWYVVGGVFSSIGLFLTGLLPITHASLPLLTVVVVVANFFVSFLAMSTESFMAYDVAHEMKGKAGGYFQSGNLGGFGVGGGVGLWLAGHVPSPWMAAFVMALLCLLCCLALFAVKEKRSTVRAEKITATFRNLFSDLWLLLKSRGGLVAAFLCFLPLGTGAASNLFAAVAGDWHASADTVALITGVMGGLFSAAGCVIGGWICDKINRNYAYLLFGLLGAFTAVGMAFSPHTELAYTIWTSVYMVVLGLSYAGFSAFVLDAIGKGAAATKYNIYASLSNMPIYLMTFIDGWAHTRFGPTGMLAIEALFAVLAIALFLILTFFVNRNFTSKAAALPA